MRFSFITAIFTFGLLAIIYTDVTQAFDQHVSTTHGEMEFDEMAPYVDMANAHGDMKEGAHGTVGKMKAGSKTPRHFHSNPYHGVVVSGTMVHTFDGQENPPELTAGSYWYAPAEKIHYTKCLPDEECVFYIHSDGKFDMTEIEEE